jgi:hypothetical protein
MRKQHKKTQKGSTEKTAASGVKCIDLSAFFDPDSFSWKTRQASLYEDSPESLGSFPSRGTARSGSLFQLQGLKHLTDDAEPLSWRTPTARDYKGMSAKSWRERSDGDNTPTLCDQIGGVPNPEWIEWMMGLPPGWTELKQSETQSAPQQIYPVLKYVADAAEEEQRVLDAQ